MDDQDNPLGKRRILGMQIGVVADRRDPDGLGRVRIRIPTLFDPDPTPWAWPLGGGGGGGKVRQGGFVVPADGAEVAVFFKDGDPEHPYFLAANFGAPAGARETPTPVKDLLPADSPDVAAFEFGDYYVQIDNRDGQKKLEVKHKVSEDAIEHNGKDMAWQIKGTSLVRIVADGQIDISAPMITINGRVVQDTDRGI